MEREYFKIMYGSCDFCHKLESQQKGTSFWLSRFSALNVVTDKLENSKPRWIFNFKTLTTSCFTLHISSPLNNTTTKRDLWKQTKGQPLPFYIPFLTKSYAFRIPSFGKWYCLSQIMCDEPVLCSVNSLKVYFFTCSYFRILYSVLHLKNSPTSTRVKCRWSTLNLHSRSAPRLRTTTLFQDSCTKLSSQITWRVLPR